MWRLWRIQFCFVCISSIMFSSRWFLHCRSGRVHCSLGKEEEICDWQLANLVSLLPTYIVSNDSFCNAQHSYLWKLHSFMHRKRHGQWTFHFSVNISEQRLAAVALFASIDANGDGAISEGEGRTYLMSESDGSARMKRHIEQSAWWEYFLRSLTLVYYTSDLL